MGQADPQLGVFDSNFFEVDRAGVFDEAVRLPGHSSVEHDGLIILQAFLIDGIHHGIVRIKSLLGRMKLQPGQLLIFKRMLQHLQRVGAIGIHAGKADEPVWRCGDNLFDFVIGNHPAAISGGQIHGKKHKAVDPLVIHAGEQNVKVFVSAAVAAGRFACHSNRGGQGILRTPLKHPVTESARCGILCDLWISVGMNVYVNYHL